MTIEEKDTEGTTPVLDLSLAPGERKSWDRPRLVVYLWAMAELLLVTNPWQISSRVRVAVLRAFGAQIGVGVVFRPRTRVRFPWKLSIGARSWVGEGAWIHNQDVVAIGSDCVISQECFVTTGSHAFRHDMALITKPVTIESGAWVTARAVVLGGTTIGKSAVLGPNSVAGPNQSLDPSGVYTGNPARKSGVRF